MNEAKIEIPDTEKLNYERRRKLYQLLSSLREGINNVSDSKTANVQNDVDELHRLSGLADRAIGILIGTGN